MYLIATHLGPIGENGFHTYASSQLYEATTVAERHEIEARHDRVSRVTAAYAHRWVREGGIHSTGLYTGEDRYGRRRVLKAKGE